MTTRGFIEKCVNGYITGNKHCSSVFCENGNIYSYGYHYPLLIKTDAGYVLNDKGYSQTTSKHISWARPFSIGAIHFYHNATPNKDGVILSINEEIEQLMDKRQTLSQRAWKQREQIINRLAQLEVLHGKLI